MKECTTEKKEYFDLLQTYSLDQMCKYGLKPLATCCKRPTLLMHETSVNLLSDLELTSTVNFETETLGLCVLDILVFIFSSGRNKPHEINFNQVCINKAL